MIKNTPIKKIKLTIKNKTKGFYVIESVIAIIVFMVGILGMAQIQNTSIQSMSDSQFRLNATYLGSSIVAQMWANKPNITSYATSGGSTAAGDGYNAWLTELKASVPGVDSNPPTITVTPVGTNAFNVSVTIFWKNPSNGTVAQYVTQSTIF